MKEPNISPLEDTDQITIKISRSVHRKVKKEAYIKGMKMSKVIEFAILNYLNLEDNGRFV